MRSPWPVDGGSAARVLPVARAAYPLLKATVHGRLINVASRTFYMGNSGQLPYVASKGAVLGLTLNLAKAGHLWDVK